MKIMHILRAPLGGLYRHVLDVCDGQIRAGHDVGIICDENTFDEYAQSLLAPIQNKLKLGFHKVKMARAISWVDGPAILKIKKILSNHAPDIVHGHGAKGGAYARLCAPNGAKRIYTPHGGSLHYKAGTPAGILFGNLEKLLFNKTDRLIFESEFAKLSFEKRFGSAKCPTFVVHNGLRRDEFKSIKPNKLASDFLFIGELRLLKGVDVLIKAFATLVKQNPNLKLSIVGSGSDEMLFAQLVQKLNIAPNVIFHGRMPASKAFALGHTLIVPSRAESLPYIVLEAIAASKPIICSMVGGIPEILGHNNKALIPADNVNRLTHAMQNQLMASKEEIKEQTKQNLEKVKAQFSQEHMIANIFAAYSA